MNGYFQINIHAISIKGKSLSFTKNGKRYNYTCNNSRLVMLIRDFCSSTDALVNVGFMIKDNKIIGQDSIEIVEKNLLRVNPHLKIKTNNSKVSKIKSANENHKSKKDKVLKTRKMRQSRINIKLSHRYKIIEVPASKIIFKKGFFQIVIGETLFNEVMSLSVSGFNNVANQVSEKLRIRAKNTTMLVDNGAKSELAKALNKIINERKQKKTLNESAVKKEDKPEVKLVSKLEKESKPTKLKKKVKEKKKVIQKIQLELILSNSWNDIRFQDGFFSYRYKLIKNNKCKSFLNHLKQFFTLKSFEYTIEKEGSNIKNVVLPKEIFEMIKLGEKIDRFFFSSKSLQTPNQTFSLSKYNLSYSEILSVFGKRKTFYLEYLFSKHINEFEMVCVPEPIYASRELIRRDISFLFTIQRFSGPIFIWESVEPNKASYVFIPSYKDKTIKESQKAVERFLMEELPYKRSMLRKKDGAIIDGISKIRNVRHEYYFEKDIYWQLSIEHI